MTTEVNQNNNSTPVDSHKPNIFIVDDDKFLVDMYSLKFQKSGFQITCSLDPEEALKKIRDGFAPDIMLTDIIMPGITGLDLVEAIRKDKLLPNACIIMLTNQGAAEDVERARKLNVDGYIVKATTIPSEVVNEVEAIYSSKKDHKSA
jgi:two-component system phosphate regulon response regulator PhoB